MRKKENNKYKSCGCGAVVSKVGYKGIIWAVFRSYEIGAKGRNIPFNITIKDMWDKYLEQDKKCALTGMGITLPKTYKEYNRYEHTASLDRLKNKFDEEELIEWCKKIYFHTMEQGNSPD